MNSQESFVMFMVKACLGVCCGMASSPIQEEGAMEHHGKAESARHVNATYPIATLGSKTKMGGEVATATSGLCVDNIPLARVGDTIRYPDGTESKIVSGAGNASVFGNQPAAIVGSAADNGDIIIDSRQYGFQVAEYSDDGKPAPGFLQAGYVPPPPVRTSESGRH